jgi:elongator complex protein 3
MGTEKEHACRPERRFPGPDQLGPGLTEAVERLSKMVLDGEIISKKSLQDAKVRVMRDHKASTIPTNAMIIAHMMISDPEGLEDHIWLLRKRPSRTLSGVAVVAAMTSPYPCPHGRCTFCPGGPTQEVATPQSYTGREPAAMRAAQNFFDPYQQVRKRLEQLSDIGHPTDKVDLVLMGGTMTARPLDYQLWFVKGCLDALNGTVSPTFEDASVLNETASHRCIGMTFETRPDWFGTEETDMALSLGGTRVELGVQSVFDRPLEASRRGHCVDDAVEATQTAKDSGLKVGYHLMPGIPGSDPEMDLDSARKVLTDESFMPDMIKIYPTLVIEGTDLYRDWMAGSYRELTTEEAARMVASIKEITPPWVRIQRVQRDIPSPLVEAGVTKSNLRQLSVAIMEERGTRCRCIRCREVGHRLGPETVLPGPEDIELVTRTYRASGGEEHFISFEVPHLDALVGYARLRMPSDDAHRPEMTGAASLRELKVFGPLVPIGARAEKEWQHRGYGRKLLEEAERTALSVWDRERLLVTSGIGAREYYRKLGYERMGPYMSKEL